MIFRRSDTIPWFIYFWLSKSKKYFWFFTNLTLFSIYFRMIRLLVCNQSKNDTCLNHPFWVSALSPDIHGCLVFPLADSRHCLLPLRFSRSGKTSGRSKRLIQVIYRLYMDTYIRFYTGIYRFIPVFPCLIAAIAYYHYASVDPDWRPVDQKDLHRSECNLQVLYSYLQVL